MSEEEIKYLHAMTNYVDPCDTIGETENFFFGVLDYSDKLYMWIKNVPYVKFEWSLI